MEQSGKTVRNVSSLTKWVIDLKPETLDQVFGRSTVPALKTNESIRPPKRENNPMGVSDQIWEPFNSAGWINTVLSQDWDSLVSWIFYGVTQFFRKKFPQKVSNLFTNCTWKVSQQGSWPWHRSNYSRTLNVQHRLQQSFSLRPGLRSTLKSLVIDPQWSVWDQGLVRSYNCLGHCKVQNSVNNCIGTLKTVFMKDFVAMLGIKVAETELLLSEKVSLLVRAAAFPSGTDLSFDEKSQVLWKNDSKKFFTVVWYHRTHPEAMFDCFKN